MNNNNLLASVALFSELYNSNEYTNIPDIIAEFIKGVVVSENKWSTTPLELKQLLEEIYGFNIPEAIVRSTVRNRLKDVAEHRDGYYHFQKHISDNFEKLDTEYVLLKEIQQNILANLFNYIGACEDKELTDKEKHGVEINFQHFLMDNGFSDTYSNYISAFVIKNSKDLQFRKNLNLIREGIILYNGIRYSADLNIMGVWNTDLTIFLGTEHLLSALGYNGILFKELFEDFYKLVTEINHSNKNRGNDKRITLKYFKESQDEIDTLFDKAERIIKGSANLTAHRPAMIEILNGCKHSSDIVVKKVRLFSDLKLLGITLQEFSNDILFKYPDYNVEDSTVVEAIKKESLAKGRAVDEELCYQLFRIFTKINYYRGGVSKDKFENIGHIYITNNSLALYLAHNNKVKFEEKDIPFAKDLDYITNKFWYKLMKGLGANNTFPKSFDVVTKAQLILSSHVNQSISNSYEKLIKEYNGGKLTLQQASDINYELREKLNKPEEITIETVEKSLYFLTVDSSFEDYLREKQRKDQLLDEAQKRTQELEREIKRRDEVEAEKLQKNEEDMRLENKRAFVHREWKKESGEKSVNALFFVGVIILTMLPIILTITLKIYKGFEAPASQWQNKQYCYIFGAIFWYVVELICRAYLFDKEKIKNGWKWIVLAINRPKFNQYKIAQLEQYEHQFDNDFPSQISSLGQVRQSLQA